MRATPARADCRWCSRKSGATSDSAATYRTRLMRRLQLFFYGNGNLAGLALALLGPVLLFAGVIGAGWGWITLGLYVAGLLLGWALQPAGASFERALRQHWGAADFPARIDALVPKARPMLTPVIQKYLASVHGSGRGR